jgi:hypothetical protein
MSPGMGKLLCMLLVDKVKCRIHRCQSPPKPGVRQVGEGIGASAGEDQYSVGNRTLVLERSCSVMIHTRPSGDSGTS